MTNMLATEFKSHSVFNAYLSLTLVNDTYAETQAFLQFLMGRSMTNMQATEFKSHSVFNAYLSLTMVNDKYAGYRF